MNSVILCPGPSLAKYSPRSTDLVVCVNRSATIHPCDAWAGCDLPMVEQYGSSVIGSPILLMYRETIEELAHRGIPWRGPAFDRREMLSYCPDEFQWLLFSATTALVYAAYRGATEIDVYGADWKGTADFDGIEAGKNRRPERWELESAIWQKRLIPWLKERGVGVRRIGHE